MYARLHALTVALGCLLLASIYLLVALIRSGREREEPAQPDAIGDPGIPAQDIPASIEPVIPADVLELMPDVMRQVDDGSGADGSGPGDPWAVLTEGPEPPDHVMISPVEIWFEGCRVGVRPGTPIFAQFQRFASELFDELESATHFSR